MLVGIVPTERKKERWQDSIKTERDYNIAVDSGCGWLLFPDLPFSWGECKQLLSEYEAKVKYCKDTREDNYKASCRLEGIFEEGHNESD